MDTIKNCVTLSVRHEKNRIYMTNERGQEWKLPKTFSERAAVSMLVYGALMNRSEKVSSFSSKYKISIEVEILD